MRYNYIREARPNGIWLRAFMHGARNKQRLKELNWNGQRMYNRAIKPYIDIVRILCMSAWWIHFMRAPHRTATHTHTTASHNMDRTKAKENCMHAPQDRYARLYLTDWGIWATLPVSFCTDYSSNTLYAAYKTPNDEHIHMLRQRLAFFRFFSAFVLFLWLSVWGAFHCLDAERTDFGLFRVFGFACMARLRRYEYAMNRASH